MESDNNQGNMLIGEQTKQTENNFEKRMRQTEVCWE